MTSIKSGDLVVLRSGGPVMTVDTVNTDIFDDAKVTGVLCVWFVDNKLQRVRFDHRVLEPANPVAAHAVVTEEVAGDYSEALDSMVDALNAAADAAQPKPATKTPATKAARKTARTALDLETSVTPNGVPVRH